MRSLRNTDGLSDSFQHRARESPVREPMRGKQVPEDALHVHHQLPDAPPPPELPPPPPDDQLPPLEYPPPPPDDQPLPPEEKLVSRLMMKTAIAATTARPSP